MRRPRRFPFAWKLPRRSRPAPSVSPGRRSGITTSFRIPRRSAPCWTSSIRGSPVFLRQIQTETPLRFRLHSHARAELVQNGARYASQGATGGMLVELPSGVPIFMNYLTHVPEWYQVVWTGKVQAEQDPRRTQC